MKPDWDKLMEEYKSHASILIADVDCTAEGKDLCEEVGVQGFPTLKYGDPNNLEDYEGGRSLQELQKFAKGNLGPRCGPANMDLCDTTTKALIDGFTKMDSKTLREKVAEQDAAIAKIDGGLEELLKNLQEQYETFTKGVEEKKKAIKESGLGLMKSVAAHRRLEL
mmetsp:Transcript_65062/g.146103  ORF Transcript_65062/g.146103 Transcript_65062/m.146103 type:complete len:166 (+) Transcript_65062:203-700(+)